MTFPESICLQVKSKEKKWPGYVVVSINEITYSRHNHDTAILLAKHINDSITGLTDYRVSPEEVFDSNKLSIEQSLGLEIHPENNEPKEESEIQRPPEVRIFPKGAEIDREPERERLGYPPR